MKSSKLILVPESWLISDKIVTDTLVSNSRYLDLPAKAIMIDQESVENLPVELNSENDTKYKVKVVGKNFVNYWPIYSFELIEKFVNNELVPTEIKMPLKKRARIEKISDQELTKFCKTKKPPAKPKMTEEEKEARKHDRLVAKLMETVLINLGDSIATPGCCVFLEWESGKSEDFIYLKERLKPSVAAGYKQQASFKISMNTFLGIFEAEDDIRE